MRTRTVGPMQVSEVGFGAAQLGNLYRTTTDEEALAAVDEAWNQGIRYFDTAPHYGLGLSERRLGAALSGRARDSFLLSTKVGRLLVPTPERAAAGERDAAAGFDVPATHARVWDFSRDGVLRSIESSLDRLGLDRLDIAYLHDPDQHWDESSTTGIAALIELRDQGVVRAIGAGMNETKMLTRFIRECDIDLVMVAGRYTLLDHRAEEELLPAAEERGVAVVAAAVYNSGLLSSPTVPDDASFDYEQASSTVLDRARALAALSTAHGTSLPAAAVQFPLRNRLVASVVVGMRTADQVAGTVERYRSPIAEDTWNAIEGHRR